MRGALPQMALGVGLLLAAPLWAKTGTPGPVYFIGSYDLAGRGSDGARPLSGRAQIQVLGQGVMIRHCGLPDVSLGFGPAFEVVNLMSGSMGAEWVECLFHNNGYNRPILTCRSQGGAAFTLWPVDTKEQPLVC